MKYFDVKGYEGQYVINEYGQVRPVGSHHMLVGTIDKKGYISVSLGEPHYVHNLVAAVFLINPDNKPILEHIDGNRSNNHYTNLRWVSEYTDLPDYTYKAYFFSDLIATFNTAAEAALKYGISPEEVQQSALAGRNSIYGIRFHAHLPKKKNGYRVLKNGHEVGIYDNLDTAALVASASTKTAMACIEHGTPTLDNYYIELA